MNGFLKQVSFWIILLIIAAVLLGRMAERKSEVPEPAHQVFEEQLMAGNVKELVFKPGDGNWYKFTATFKEKVNGAYQLEFTHDKFLDKWRDELDKQGVPYEGKEAGGMLMVVLINVLPLLLILGLFFFMFRQAQAGGNKAMSFGRSRARMSSTEGKQVTFKDVAGVEEAKEELVEIIEFLKDPKKFTRLGGKIPKGVLLVGPPGSGKTLLARAVSGEAGVPFFSISGSDFVEMFVGVGASRVRDLFQQGQKHAPCIIFIDEIDAVGRQRGAGFGGGHDEREQTLNQLLVEMDGFNTSEGVILMAATNRPDVLDQALLRPGRFDRQVVVANPDINGREAILGIHIRNNEIPVDDSVNVRTLARGTSGFSGADLANMVNEAALLAARRDRDLVTMLDFEEAKDRVLMGPERRSMVISPSEKLNTAYHEAGHVLVSRLTPDSDPVHKVTVIPRGPALGVTSMLPKEDRHSIWKTHCLAMLRVNMGGRAAEEIMCGQFSSGAANDLKTATKLAHAMVCQWGMSELGPISFGSDSEVFLGRDFVKERDFSEETASAVDNAIHSLLDAAYADAKKIVETHKDIIVAMAQDLCEKETLEGNEIDEIIRRVGGEDLLPEPEPEPEEEAEPKPPVPDKIQAEPSGMVVDVPVEERTRETDTTEQE